MIIVYLTVLLGRLFVFVLLRFLLGVAAFLDDNHFLFDFMFKSRGIWQHRRLATPINPMLLGNIINFIVILFVGLVHVKVEALGERLHLVVGVAVAVLVGVADAGIGELVFQAQLWNEHVIAVSCRDMLASSTLTIYFVFNFWKQ